MLPFFAFNRQQLKNKIAVQFGFPKAELRAESLFRSVYKQANPSCKTGLGMSNELNDWLTSCFDFDIPVLIESIHFSTHDGAVKFAMRMKSDGKLVESVLIPERGRLTQCISTQVGCAQACRFCQTGRMGLLRNLTTEEMVGQVLLAERWRQENPSSTVSAYARISNIVYMGMGEPLDNIDNVILTTQIFCDNKGLNFSPNKVTVSTVGLLPALNRILEETNVAVALSLHSPFEDERSRVMPVNLRHPLTQTIETIKKQFLNGRRRAFMIQYTLLRGVNDSERHALALVDLLKGIHAKINLIPLNEHEGAAFRRPDLGRVYQFQQVLKNAGMVATIRLSKGRDIQAACGQLIKNKV